MTNSDKTLIIVTGPTAVGKTSLSIELAKIFSTEIISVDSRQFYRELKIGTAPPTSHELQEVKHHFIGHLSIHDYYNVSKFETDAIDLLNNLFCSHEKVLLTGGSGLYINAVLNGIDDLPDPEESTRSFIKSLYAAEGISSLRKLLKELDPEYYEQVDLKNQARLIRALEVCLTTGEKFSSLRKNSKKLRDFKFILIGLDRKRDELFARISQRTDEMIASGLVDEAKSLLPYRHLNALNTVGYKELFEHFDDLISLDQAVEDIKTNTRRYAKRQLTWFKKMQELQWFHPDEKENIIDFIKTYS
jgi:tRNA dimethylallyltransferase